MTDLSYAVVIPTIGRPGLADLIAAVDGDPAPSCIVVADDRRRATSELDLPQTATPLLVVRTGGRGPAAARNAGWRAADAEWPKIEWPENKWIAFLDDDVAISTDWCRRLVKDLEELPDNVAASQAWIYVPSPEGRRPTDHERRTLGLNGALWITADMAYRRTALVETGGFDERFPRAFREDADLALRTVRNGYAIAWGERVTTHPLASSTGWHNGLRGSLRDQAGNADNALMRAKYGHRWRSLIGTPPGRPGRHLITSTAAITGVVACALSLSKRSGRIPRLVAAAAGLVWVGMTAEFAASRILAGPRTVSEISSMVVTSVLIPPLAVGHRLRGELRVRLAGRSAVLFGHRSRDRRSRGMDNAVSGKPRAVLFDRDGTLIKDVPYLADPQRVQPVPGARRTLNQLRRQGVAVGVVSNQSGVARGLINPDELARVNARVESLLGPFDTWQVCPHAPDARCSCRKPEPGMVTAAARELGLAPGDCLLIGDIGSDVDAALAAGARAVLVPTRHTKIDEIDHAHVVAAVAPNLRTAVRRHVGRSR